VVTDASGGFPIPGVNIMIKGSQSGTIANMNGEYSITVAQKSILFFSIIGYETFEVETGQGTTQTINVQLNESSQNLDEVVVIGYGTTLKKEVTGSISTIKSDEFNKGAYNDALGLIQGKVAGLSIIKPSGADPMAGYNIVLRGTNTLVSGQGPLIIIDGVAGADLKNVNFEDVQSFDVLKDGSAAAIYGTRGTNGVIIITTKRAKSGKASIEYSGNISVQVAPKGVEILTADEFKSAIETYAPSKIGSIYGANTNWFNEITRETPISQKHNLAISGGTETFSHRTTFSVERNTGLLKDNESNKYLFKTNIKQKAFGDYLELDYNLLVGIRQYRPANYDLFYQAFIQNPTQPVYDENNVDYGGYSSLPGIIYYNPVAMLNERERNGKTINVNPNLRAKLKLLNGLNFVNFISFEGSNYNETSYKSRYYPTIIGSNGEAEISNGGNLNMQFESTLDYATTLGKNSLQVVGGYSYQESVYNNSYMINSDFDFDLYGADNIGAGAALGLGKATMSSYKESNKLIAFFGRVMYNFNDKYLASVSYRREGSSRFGENNKWGDFPAVSFGWRINNEGFMNNINWMNDLKLRVGYGVTGNQDFASYKSLILMGPAGKFLYNGPWINTYQPISNPNPDLRWELKKEVNAGIDFSIFDNRIGGTLDFYSRESKDLLYTYDVSVPPYIYNKLFTNVGTIGNKGVEFTLNLIPVKNQNFIWTSIFTFSKNTNKLIKFSNEEFTAEYIDVAWMGVNIPQYAQRIEEGKSLGTFFGPVWIGLDKYGKDKFENQDPSTGVVNAEDYEPIGNAYPFCTLGWSNAFTYKKWNFNFALRSNIGGDVLNFYRAYYENWETIGTRNIVSSQLDNPRFTGTPTYSSKYIEDATFVKLDNISLGYSFNLKSKYISALQLSLTAQDVLLLTKYQGVDPEVSLSGLEPGLEKMTYYPRTTSLTFGLNITF
jgi:TonB-linked SusC/RagA family outer membrane protein